jgi:IS4 transposase
MMAAEVLSMILDKVFDLFVARSPVAVMFRGLLERIFNAERIDALFVQTARRQYEDTLLFYTVVALLGEVVNRQRKSINAAYLAQAESIGVSVKAVYDKLGRVELPISERLVRETAADLATVIRRLHAAQKPLLKGYRLLIADGNHLAGTDHRLGELRRTNAAALPGQACVVLDPELGLAVDVVACEDGHANERSLIPRILGRMQPGECWMADRMYCTKSFLREMARREVAFIIRHHRTDVPVSPLEKPRKLGEVETGVVWEAAVRVDYRDAFSLTLRQITICLDTPTRDGEQEIQILTNLPARISGRRIARLYRTRWSIEHVFQDLATTLRSEVNTLGYPKAALLGFCLALVTFNLLSTLKGALRSAHKLSSDQPLSTYYLADEIAMTWRGMEIAIPEPHWKQAFGPLTLPQLARLLHWLAKHTTIEKFFTHPWTPKRPQPKRESGYRGRHVATSRLLEQRRKQ